MCAQQLCALYEYLAKVYSLRIILTTKKCTVTEPTAPAVKEQGRSKCVQTMLRVWDCFLLEGPKVLFRVALALLQLHEEAILERNDTISVMKVIKAAARLTYDVHHLLKVLLLSLPGRNRTNGGRCR